MIRFLNTSRRRMAAAIAAAAAITLGGGFALDAAGASAQNVNAQQEVSQNWSGYIVQSSTGQSFSSVSGSWVEPSIDPSSATEGTAAFWVGLGGANQQSQSLEQVGTAAQVVDGQITYSAWYELVPSAQVTLPLTIHPGDKMTGKVVVSGTNVTISLSDQTTGQSVTKTLQMATPDSSSAEWIAEAPAAELPNGSLDIVPLANFGKVTFTNASATAGGHTGSISDSAWAVQQVNMDSAGSDQFGVGGRALSPTGLAAALSQQSSGGASAGTMSNNGTSFTVSYSSTSTASPPTVGGAGATGRAFGYPGSGYGYPGYGQLP